MPVRPTQGGSLGTWGNELNTWLDVAHNSDGSLLVSLKPTSVKIANYNAISNDFIPVDTTSGNVTITLPNAPQDGIRITVKLIAQTGANKVTISAQGSDVFNKAGGSTSLTISFLNQAINLQYNASSHIWHVLSTDTPVSSVQSIGSRSYIPLSKLTDIGWDTTHFPFTVTRVDDIVGSLRSVATINITPEGVFDSFSTARSAPAQTLHVATTGSDSTGTGSSGNPYKTLWKAFTVANTAGTPTTIIMAAGVYQRNLSDVGGTLPNRPTVDIALLANGGRVTLGTFDKFTDAVAFDGTLTHCQSFTFSSVSQVLDMANLDSDGNYTVLKLIPGTDAGTGARCNATPNSWFLGTGTNGGTSGVLYINRGDQQFVTSLNTRIYRPNTDTITIATEINFYMGGVTVGDGFDIEGGRDGKGAFRYEATTPANVTRHVLCVRDSTFKYSAGTDSRGVSVESLYGLAYFQDCAADSNVTDGFNGHNTNGATAMHILTVNCTGTNNGRLGNASCNGWTTHDNVKGVDLCGYYRSNHGGSIRSIATSMSWLVSSVADRDLGDICLGGNAVPTGIQVGDSAVYYCERTKIVGLPGGHAYKTDTNTSAIYRRDCEPTPIPDYGTGTFGSY